MCMRHTSLEMCLEKLWEPIQTGKKKDQMRHNLISPKNWERFALYSDSHFTLSFSSRQAPCASAVSRGGFQVQICSVQ